MWDLAADEHEPAEILRLLGQVKDIDLDVKPLNSKGWADYFYTAEFCHCHEACEYNTERKTFSDLVHGIDEIEVQLAWQMEQHPYVHNRLIIEGVIEPAVKGVYLYRKQFGKNVFTAGLQGTQAGEYSKIIGWLHQVSKYWEVVYSPSMASTAMIIASYFKADQVPDDEHDTFHRTFKSRNYHVDEQVLKIMNAGPKGFGPKAAEAVKARFGTAWRAWKAPLDEWLEVPGIGKLTAQKYLREIGRGDV